jgi:hypothetical protein
MKYLSLTLLVVAVALAGCFSIAKMGVEEVTGEKADIEVIKPITANLKEYHSIEVANFTSGIGDLAPAALVDGLSGEVIADIKTRGLFQNVSPSSAGKPAAPTLLVEGTVTDYKKPDSGAKRIVSKAALLTVNFVVKDKGTGAELGRALARGRLQTMFRGGEDTLMKKAAASVASFIDEAHTPTSKK